MTETSINAGNNGLLNVNFDGKKRKITSPLSVEALRRSGLVEDDLFKVTLSEFKQLHPEFNNFSSEKLSKRYEFYEQRRKKLIREAMDVCF